MLKEVVEWYWGKELDWKEDLSRLLRHESRTVDKDEFPILRKKLADYIINSENPDELINDVLKTSERYRGRMYSVDFAVDLLSMAEKPFKEYIGKEIHASEEGWYVICQAMVRTDMDLADKLVFLEQVYENGNKWIRFAATDAAQYLCWEDDPETRQKTRGFLRSILPLEEDERIIKDITTTLMET